MRGWSWLGLVAVLLFDVWLRGHTVGPTLRHRFGLDLYPVTGAEAEPLDCDEAVYAYIGRRIDQGAVMYRDLTENKPPGGYGLYALAVAVGGADELTVRLMPLPMVLATTATVWWLARRLRGPGAAVVAAAAYAVMSTDPFVYGNGAHMEHMINLFAVAALAFVVTAWDRPGRGRLVAAGACVGAACLVKQVAALHGLVFAAALLLRGRPLPGRLRDLAAVAAGFATVVGAAVVALVFWGAGWSAYDDIIRYGAALATDTPPPPNAPPTWLRWVTGNADPEGNLPWPFGRTNYLVWWGTGTWPFWLSGVPAVVWLSAGRGSGAGRRLVAAWTASAWVQVAMPGLFWPHYYLLPVPGLAVAVAVFLADQAALARSGTSRRALHGLVALATAAAVAWTVRLQVVEYLRVPPVELTVRHKGGAQWVAQRALGRDLARRSAVWDRPKLFVWGWQGTLYFYSGLDGASRQVFVDDLLKTFAGTDHPLIRPRVERILRELRADPPALVFAGYPPFPALREFLRERYLPSMTHPVTPDGRGLWVERDRYGAFETFGRGPATRRQ
jgi:4-amino-4-deoxy-L-arabinose transferase-like glycosyltransferase